MRTWALLLGGLIAWSAQFFALYIIASVFETTALARGLAIIVTLLALAADGAVFVRAARWQREAGDRFGRWLASLSLLIAGTSAIAIAWQGAPAILS